LLLSFFNEAPITIIESFGRLTGYDSDALRRHAERWKKEYQPIPFV
jgi:hypothetical protein